MKLKLFALITCTEYTVVLIVRLPTQPTAAASHQQQGDVVAFVNVNVIPMDTERMLENQALIVEGDRITAIGPADEVTVPDGAEIVEGNGAYLMPGLADMHMHIGGISRTFEGPDQLRFYLAEGVTTIRNLSAMSEDLVWRDEIARGEE
ncbi:hypothetical protein KFU94_42540 [Chloroflexi bacterium TSY]|nr:hypothetical protein [Chloroflexi bacterium TSY]